MLLNGTNLSPFSEKININHVNDHEYGNFCARFLHMMNNNLWRQPFCSSLSQNFRTLFSQKSYKIVLNMIKYWGQNNPCSTKNIINTVGMFRTAFCTHWAQKHRPVGSSQRVLGTRTITLYVCLHSWQWSQPARKHRIDKPFCFSTMFDRMCFVL